MTQRWRLAQKLLGRISNRLGASVAKAGRMIWISRRCATRRGIEAAAAEILAGRPRRAQGAAPDRSAQPGDIEGAAGGSRDAGFDV
ncbi:MAG TPA: hypothetical protein DHV63_04165 [Pseudomonas sp.]|nr:hypothetical protein [Pseudomonas sp.]